MITYQMAQRCDAGQIQQLLEALATSLNEREHYRGTQETLEHFGFDIEDPCFQVLLAFDGEDEAVGLCLFFREYSTWRAVSGIYVQDLYVKDSMRGQGLGRALLHQAAAEAARRWQCGYLRLSVHNVNGEAQRFYSKLGMTPDTENTVFRATGSTFRNMCGQ